MYQDYTKYLVNKICSNYTDEILVNAVDNYQRDKKMSQIKVTVNKDKGNF